MNWQSFSEHLQQAHNLPIQIQSAHSVAGGDINQAYQLNCGNQRYFLKVNQAHLLPLFSTEAHSLNAIRQSNAICCPNVLAYGQYANQAWLLLEHLPLTARGDDFEKGLELALMHQNINQQSQPFGWFEDNFIGNTPQKNRWHFEWVDFYANQRLKPQLELAVLNGATHQLYEQGLKLIEQLPKWFDSYQPQASLLHGDLWGGNSAFVEDSTKQNPPVIFDPASYYGDRETDLAMTELFGGYSQEFYNGYNQANPIDKGYKTRKPLYNLYHLLNHFNLFGGHYQQQSLTVINQLLASNKQPSP